MNGQEQSSPPAAEPALLLPRRNSLASRAEHVPVVDARRFSSTARAPFQSEFLNVWTTLGAFEWVSLSYLALSAEMIAAFSRNLVHPGKVIAAQAAVGAIIFLLCAGAASFEQRLPRSEAGFSAAFWHFWRHWYPHLFFLFCFEELGYLAHLVNPHWQDARLIAFDHSMFGVHPSVWLEQFATPLRNDLFQLAYLTYFVYLLVLGGILYYRREWRAYWSVMTYSAVAYAIGYLISILFPIQSPWFAMAGMWQGGLHGGPFTAIINFIEHYGRVRGAAFPSEHVAGSVAALWGAWRHRRWLFWVMLPMVGTMCVSTVWGRYHYVADVFAGMITGTLGFVIGNWLVSRQSSAPLPRVGRISSPFTRSFEKLPLAECCGPLSREECPPTEPSRRSGSRPDPRDS